MASSTVHLKSKHTGQMKQAPVGYSWTVLFFFFFVPFIRGDWKWGGIMLLLGVATIITSSAMGAPVPSYGPLSIIFGFVYNKIYLKGLISKGYEVTSIENGDIDFISSKIGVTLPQAE